MDFVELFQAVVAIAVSVTPQQISGGQIAPLARDHFMKASDKLAGQSERVLGLTWLERPGIPDWYFSSSWRRKSSSFVPPAPCEVP
jgi:hypothetical protein